MYEIDLNGDGIFEKERFLNQEIQRNGWVSLGVYNLSGPPRLRLSNITEDGRGTERVAWDAAAIQPLLQKPRHIVAALGDSYASGEGAGSYEAESDSNHGTHRWNACRRSFHAWPRTVTLPGANEDLGTLSDRYDPNHELGFVACSGAKTWNVTGMNEDDQRTRPWSWTYPDRYDEGEGQFHEMPQIDSGVLDENTTLVTLSLGGNDEGAFTDAITDCYYPLPDCAVDADFLPDYKAIIDRTAVRLANAISKIHNKAPNAEIVLLSYPEPLSRTVNCDGSGWIDVPEARALGELAGYMAAKQAETAVSLRNHGISVHAANPIPEFLGRGACDSPEWIHATRFGPNGEGDFHNGDRPSPFCFSIEGACLSRESFHPKVDGTAAYARVLRNKLDEIGYT